MFAYPQNVRRENGLKFGKVLSSLDQGEVSDRIVEIQDIEGKHVDIDFDLADLGSLS